MIYEEIRERIERVRIRATKIGIKGNYFEPITLRTTAENYLCRIDKVYAVYTSAPSYRTKDFTSYVTTLRADADSLEAFAERVEAVAEAIKRNG